jgi:hypothetical protein
MIQKYLLNNSINSDNSENNLKLKPKVMVLPLTLGKREVSSPLQC